MLWITSAVLAALAYRSLFFWEPGLDHVTAVEGWFFLPTNTSPKFVLLLALTVAYRRRRQIGTALNGVGSPALAFLPLLAGTALHAWGLYTGATDLLVASLVLTAFGACLLAMGPGLARALCFPLVILLFAIPLPAVLTNQLFYDLQLWTARDAAHVLSLVGVLVVREGNAIYGAHAQFQVIDTCAGLRFIEVLTLLAVALAGWFPMGRLRTLLRIALAVPIAYGFNLLRVCFLILHPASPLSAMHIIQGWLVFLGAVLCLAYVDRLVLSHLPSGSRASAGAGASRGAAYAAPVLTALTAGMLCTSLWIPRWEVPPGDRLAHRNLPVEVDGWRMRRQLPLDRTFLASVRFSTHTSVAMERAGETVFVFVGYDDRLHRNLSFRTPKNVFIDAGWEVENRRLLKLGREGPPAESVLARSRERRLLSLTWYTNTGSLWREALGALLALDQSPLRRPGGGRVVRISTPAGSSPEELAVATERLLALAPALEAALGDGRAHTVRLDASAAGEASPKTTR